MAHLPPLLMGIQGVWVMDDLRLVTCNWDEMNLEEVSKFIHKNWIGIYKNAEDYEVVNEYLSNIQKRFPAERIFMVTNGSELQAWSALDRDGETLAEMGRWQPIVKRTDAEEDVADLILQGIRDYSKNTEITRIECQFSPLSESDEPEYTKCASWFVRNGFPKVEDEAYLTVHLNQIELLPRRTPADLSFELLERIDENALYECYYDSFASGADTEFLNMNDEQRRAKFDKSFKHDSLNLELSSVLKDKEKLAGFAFVHNRNDEEHIDRFGIRKEFRGKGLAKSHLLHVLHEAKERKTPLVSIGVDMSNMSAFNLYKNVGFEIESRAIIHAWKSK